MPLAYTLRWVCSAEKTITTACSAATSGWWLLTTCLGVPERTGGKIKMVNGFEWQRYWVFFDNGVQLGSLDGSALLRPHHWERWRNEREEVMAEMKARMEAAVAEQEALLETGRKSRIRQRPSCPRAKAKMLRAMLRLARRLA